MAKSVRDVQKTISTTLLPRICHKALRKLNLRTFSIEYIEKHLIGSGVDKVVNIIFKLNSLSKLNQTQQKS